MKVVILAGGMGTRISEESHLKPKPMIEIGGRPILWHIMKHYSSYGFNDFVICLGYRGYVIKEFFNNYFLHGSSVTFDLTTNTKTFHKNEVEPWRVTLADTGEDTMTGGRVRRIQEHVGDEAFFLTYGDGVSNLDIGKTLEFHKAHGKMGTVTAVQPSGRFGAMDIDDSETVLGFREKPVGDGGWINGGFFIFESGVFEFLKDDSTILERAPMEALSERQQLRAYRHDGFWQCMDTVRDKALLESLWDKKEAPWKTW